MKRTITLLGAIATLFLIFPIHVSGHYVFLSHSDWTEHTVDWKVQIGEEFYVEAVASFDFTEWQPGNPYGITRWHNASLDMYKNDNLIYHETFYMCSASVSYVDGDIGDEPGYVYYQADAYSDTGYFESVFATMEILSESLPTAEVIVDGLENDCHVGRAEGEALSLAVRFTAASEQNNLTGIRYYVSSLKKGLVETGFVAQSGSYGEITQNVILDEWDRWSFRARAVDDNSNEIPSQAFVIEVTQVPGISMYRVPSVQKKNEMCFVEGWTHEAPFHYSTLKVSEIEVWVDDHFIDIQYPSPYSYHSPLGMFDFAFAVSNFSSGHHTFHLRAYDYYGVMGSLSIPFTIVDAEPVAFQPKGPARVYINTPVTYVFSAQDFKGDLCTQETYAAEPGAPFGVDDNWWPNPQDFVISGSTANTQRTFTFTTCGQWELHHRVSDSTGFYNWNASPNWSPVLPVEVVSPVRNASLEWWGRHSEGVIAFDQRVAGGFGDKIFLPGDTVTMRGLCQDTDGIRDVEWIRIQVVDPSGQTIEEWLSDQSDNLNANSDGWSYMDRSFTFPFGPEGFSVFTVRVTTRMSGGETTQSHTFTLLTSDNGIPDSWKTTHGLDINDPDIDGKDLSGDGLTNLEKYRRNLDPHVYNTGTSMLGNAVPAGWPALAGADPARDELVGSTKGELTVDKNGAATYSIPFYVVPGTAGMQPSVSLNYSSQSSGNIAGYGWSLSGFSTITRGPKTKLVDNEVHGVDFSYDDQYYLDGQRLIYIGGGSGHGTAGAEYRTESDRFSRIVAVGSSGQGPLSFKVWTKAGWCLEFGGTSGSRLTANSSDHTMEVQTWAVSRVTDAYGNYMTYSYTGNQPTGEQYLTRIDYTGKSINSTIQSQPYASLRFTYESRSDTTFSYIHGSKFSVNKRLAGVGSWMGSTMVRSYAFSYVTRPASGRSLLASITESTPEGELPPTTFAYTNPPDSWVQDDRWAPPGKIDYFGNTVFADINGDGRPDCIQLVSDGDQYKMKFYFNTPTGWQEAPSWDRILPGCNEFDKLGEVRFADLNGDGLMDFMRRSDGYAYINTGSGFEYSSYWSLGGALNGAQAVSTLASGLDPKSISFIDLNGDGRPECVIYGTGMGPDGSSVTNCAVYVNRSSEGASGYWGANGWVAGQEPPATANAWEGMGNLANFGANGRRLCDFNGDGIPDFFESTLEYYNPNNPGLYTTRRQVYLGSSNDPRQANPLYDTEVNALYKPPVPTLIRDLETGASQAPSELVDINGDGLMDLVRNNSSFLDKGEEATGHEIWFNTGDGWEEAGYQYHLPEAIARTQQSAGWYYYDPTGAAFVDINNDGVVDVISSTGSDSDYVALGRIYGGWSTSSNYQLPWPLFKYTRLYSADTYYPDNESGSELLDLNGDGALDMVWHDGTNSGAALNRRANPDRLEKVTDGFGVSHTITYAPLTDATVYTRGETHPDSTQAEPLTNITPAMHVVKTITRDSDAPSAEPGTGAYDINYRYGGMRRHRLHGSLGFEWMGITDTRAGIENTTVYSQLFPTIGMGIASWSRIHGQGYGTNGALISESNTAYTTLLLNDDKTRFTYPSTVETASYNPDDGVLLTCATVTTENYDSYGNPGVVTTITGTGAGAVTLIVTNTYNNTVDSLTAATPRWHLGQLIASVSTASSASAPSNVLSNKTTRAYDETTGYLLSETLEPDAPASTNLTLTTAYGYDAYGNRSTVTVTGAAPSSARTTTTTYDTRGRFPVSVTNALGHTQTTTYNETLGVPATTTDPNGLTTTWTHDSLGRVTSETRPDGTQTLTALRWAGRSAPPGALTVVETESTGAAPAAAFQDRLGRAIYEVSINPGTFDGNPRITGIRTDYDNRGRVTQTTIPAYLHTPDEAAVQNYYDALDRIVSVERPRDEPEWDGWIGTTCAYPGRTVETTNPLGRIERAETDTLGRVIRRLNNAGEPPGTANCGEVIYTYDPLGRLKTTTVHYDDGGALTTEIFYDTRGRRIAIDDPDVGVWTYVYNAFGELISQTDAKGQTTTFAYDKLGRMISRYDNDSSTTWNYDAMPGSGGATWKGALHKITHTATGENECTETFAYDSKGRPVTHTRLIDNTSYATGYEYDGASRLAATTYPGGFKVGNTYAPGGWLKEIRAIGGRKSGYYNEVPENHLFWRADSFTPAGSIDAATLGNGLTYDRIINKYTSRVRAIYSSNPQGGDPVQHHEYVYDDVDQLTYRYDNVLGFDDYFEYDGLNRLTGYSLAQSGGGSQLPAGICTYMSIGYNVIGNITYKSDVGSYVYGDPLHPHAVTSINTVPGQFTYDANGNQLTGMGRANTWTAANKLRQIIQNNGRTSTFAFDADRQRIIQQESGGSGGTIKTIYASPLYEKVTTNGLVEEKHYIMTPLGRTAVRTVRSDGDIETRYFHADGHGTIHAVTDEQGQVEQRFHYDPWGKQTEVSNSRGGNGGGRQTRGYTDHEMLNDYNLIHMNARLYDPVIARFISADRVVQDMGDSQTYNRYSYCANNPVNTSDPTGNNFVKWLYFGPDTEEIQELLAEAYSQAREKLREKLTPGASPAPNAGAAASTNGNASATGNSLLNKGSNQDQSNATAGIQSQSNGNNENSNGTAPDNAPGPVINGDGAISPPYSGPYPRGCAIGVLQNLYWKNNPNKVPTIAQIQEATSKYYISINPWDRNPLAPSQIGVKEGVFLGTLAGVVKKGFLSDFDYTATTAFINKTDPDAFSKMIETYKGVGVTLYAEVDGKTTNHAVMYDGVNMYTSAPMTFDDHATAIPTTPQEMLKQMNSSQVLYLVPKQ